MSKLQTGRIYLTATINNLIAESEAFAKFAVSAIARHKKCDWGDVCKEDALQNTYSLENGSRIISSYNLPSTIQAMNDKVWIITEADRQYTTMLFPSEY
jgi:hypothetical protein